MNFRNNHFEILTFYHLIYDTVNNIFLKDVFFLLCFILLFLKYLRSKSERIEKLTHRTGSADKLDVVIALANSLSYIGQFFNLLNRDSLKLH